jgi:hypothetical protein
MFKVLLLFLREFEETHVRARGKLCARHVSSRMSVISAITAA